MIDAGFYNMDCMDGMKEFPDGFFDLAIVDPPYGGGVTNPDDGSGGGKSQGLHAEISFVAADARFGNKGSRFERYRQSRAQGRRMGTKVPDERGHL